MPSNRSASSPLGTTVVFARRAAAALAIALTIVLATATDACAEGVKSIAAGAAHSCAVTGAGAVQCWGRNSSGEIGDGTTIDRWAPVTVSGLEAGAVAVAVGYTSACALTASGGVKCWGTNEYGQLGDGTITNRPTPVDVSGLTSGVVAIAAGPTHACAVTGSGTLQCWGRNSYGQLGDNSTATRLTPVTVTGLDSGVVAVAAGSAHTCAVLEGGETRCWGYNGYGQVGDNTTTNRYTPVTVTGVAAVAIASGAQYTCALTTAGGIKCWGENTYGQLGDGTTTPRYSPVDVSGSTSGMAGVWSLRNHTCAVTSGGGAKCWGQNLDGQLGDSTTTPRSVPVDVVGLGSPTAAVVPGYFHTCAITASGAARCWGYNGNGRLGDNTTANRVTPGDVAGLTGGELPPPPGARVVGGGDDHSCAITRAGGVECWGSNVYGELGNGSPASYSPTPVPVAGLSSGVRALALGRGHTCAVTDEGDVWCWGGNWVGQLGDGTTTQRRTPVRITSLYDVVSLSAADTYTCATNASGTATCWGGNTYGRLGDGTTQDRLTPWTVSGLATGAGSVSAGGNHTCAVTTAGGAKCWGRNDEGQLGDNTTTERHTPVWVNGLTSGVASISAGALWTCALLGTGDVKCWGNNVYGQLGDGTTTASMLPVDVVGLPDGVGAISSGWFHACALTAAGGVACWGLNSAGQLGDGTTTNRSTPVPVSNLALGATAVDTGKSHACAVTVAGGVQCWGDNHWANLGNEQLPTSPVPVWVRGLVAGVGTVAGGDTHTCRVTPAGGVQCWGANSVGELGSPGGSALAPRDVTGLSGVVAIALGSYHSCALTSVGGMKCWGHNPDGRLGDGTTEGRFGPTDVAGLASGVRAIGAGESHTCALTAAGGVLCWGGNQHGQLGDGTTTYRVTPTWAAGLTTGVKALAVGARFSCAVTATGGVKCWGENYWGQVGDGTTRTDRSLPTRVSGLGGVAELSLGGFHACAVLAAGDVKCWGNNGSGQLGDGTTVDRPAPIDIPSLVDVAALVGARQSTCAVTLAGGVKCWGLNFRGQLGDGTTVNRSTPGNVIGLASGAGMVGGGAEHACAVTMAGQLRCWGSNLNGQLGEGTVVSRLTPRAVRGSKLAHDYDGDSRADAAVYRASSGTWFSLDSGNLNNTMRYFGWGVQAQGDLPAPGDYDGDGIVDPTVFRPATGTWFVRESAGSYTTWRWFGWGASGDILMPADYDGDGKTDAAVFRPSTGTWYVRPSGGGAQWSVVFGGSTDVPFAGHYDGDGKADIAVYRPSAGTWFVLTSASGYTDWWHRGWGLNAQGDVPAPGDYDGDGRTDLCVFRPASGSWFILESHAAYTTWNWFGWGSAGDVLVPSDYNDDGITDAAVYRPSTGTWYVGSSGGGTQWSVVFGQAGDVPLLTVR